MQALRLYAGPRARQHIEKEGLQAAAVGVIPAAAGGPKGLILGPLDRFIFGHWLPQSDQAVHLVGASIGAWRMATACLDDPVSAFQRLEHDYIAQHFELKPGEKRPAAKFVSAQFGKNLDNFYGGRIHEVLNHPRYRLHVFTSRGRHVLGREGAVRTPLGYLGAFLANTVQRKSMGAWLERVVFSSPMATSSAGANANTGAGPALPDLPFLTDDFRTRRVALSEANFKQVIQASCSIPFVLEAVHNIPGAPRGAYWDGGITDYHLHLNYADATNIIANNVYVSSASASKSSRLVLYPHFQQAVVPGWLDKGLKWRHKATRHLDTMLLLAPNPEWVKTLPNAKLPDRNDFIRYGNDLAGRVKAWTTAASASQQLADEFAAWLHKPDMGQVLAI